VLAKLSAETYGGAIELARLPQRIRGFGHVKAKAIDDARQQRAALLKALETPEARAHAA
jgi:indolepyruvate ferredoxin oxidoreductase